MSTKFLRLDLTDRRNVYVVGDIHGSFSKLREKLALVEFDGTQDVLLSVGDLIDRGPENEEALAWCALPYFHWVRGNHEDMLYAHAYGDVQAGGLKKSHGQDWLIEMDFEERKAFCDTVNDAPVIIEALCPNDVKIGIVHAAFPHEDWDMAEFVAENLPHLCMWDRKDFKNPKMNGVKNVDMVFHGHTPLWSPRSIANVHWIDTGAVYDGGNFSLVKVPRVVPPRFG